MTIIASYHDAIERLLAFLGMGDKMAHMQVGMGIYLIAQLVLRNRRASLDALTAVFVAELCNEVMDRLFFGSWRWADTLTDFAATMFWPTMVFAVGKYRRARWSRLHKSRRSIRTMRDRGGIRIALNTRAVRHRRPEWKTGSAAV
jgi:hypothetical protein